MSWFDILKMPISSRDKANIDKVMNDGKERTVNDVLDGLLQTKKDKKGRPLTLSRIATRGQISKYLSMYYERVGVKDVKPAWKK